MSPLELFKARIVWLNILDLEFAERLDWRGWAEKVILEIDGISPYWLGELTVAPDAKSALSCVCEDLEIERGAFPDFGVDEIALTFGVIYSRYARHPHDLGWVQEAWRTMCDFGDPIQYADSGDWRQYQPDQEIDLYGMNFLQTTPVIFRPISAYAVRSVRKHLRHVQYVKAFLRATLT